MSVPAGPADLTPEAISAILRGAKVIDDARVERVSPAEIGRGQGFVGRVFRCALSYDRHEPDAPRSIIVKFPSVLPAHRALFEEFGLHEREARFYTELGAGTPVPLPRCYLAYHDTAGGSVVILEDIEGIPGDALAGCDEQGAAAALDLAAAMHAAWWAEPHLDALAWLPQPNVARMRRRIAETYADAWRAYAAQAGAFLPTEILQLGHALAGGLIEALDRLSSPPRTLVHGDFQLGNMIYAPSGSIAAVVDWQVPVRARAPMDVAHFLVRGMDPAVRRDSEERLLRRYHQALVARGVAGYSFDACFDDYRLSVLSQFGLGIVLARALSQGQPGRSVDERIGALTAAVGGRLFDALISLRPQELLTPRRVWPGLPRLLRR